MIEKKFLTLDELHSEEVKMLKEIVDLCNDNDLKYYICGGTLLGAIRHKGFIPWDDDIDIMMPRDNFEKFEKMSFDNNINSNLEIWSYDNKTLEEPFCKVINKRIKIDDSCLQMADTPFLWIDIFPMDGLSENEKDNIKLYKKVIKKRKMLCLYLAVDENIKKNDKNYKKRKVKKQIKDIIKFLLGKNKKIKLSKQLDELSKTYDFDKSKYVGGVVWGYGPQEKLQKNELKDTLVDFEGLKVNTFECYDKYLKNLYGDYMKLPPVEKRVAHNLNVYKI